MHQCAAAGRDVHHQGMLRARAVPIGGYRRRPEEGRGLAVVGLLVLEQPDVVDAVRILGEVLLAKAVAGPADDARRMIAHHRCRLIADDHEGLFDADGEPRRRPGTDHRRMRGQLAEGEVVGGRVLRPRQDGTWRQQHAGCDQGGSRHRHQPPPGHGRQPSGALRRWWPACVLARSELRRHRPHEYTTGDGWCASDLDPGAGHGHLPVPPPSRDGSLMVACAWRSRAHAVPCG